jgi:hypothetical protein
MMGLSEEERDLLMWTAGGLYAGRSTVFLPSYTKISQMARYAGGSHSVNNVYQNNPPVYLLIPLDGRSYHVFFSLYGSSS